MISDKIHFIQSRVQVEQITLALWAVMSWWRYQMETFSALLALCAGNSPVTGEFPSQRPVTRSFDVFFDLRRNKRLSKQSLGWWFETPLCPLWRHLNVIRYSKRKSEGGSIFKVCNKLSSNDVDVWVCRLGGGVFNPRAHIILCFYVVLSESELWSVNRNICVWECWMKKYDNGWFVNMPYPSGCGTAPIFF